MCAYGRKWERVFLCPGRRRGTEGSLPWANFSPLRQDTIPLLPRFPSPAQWEWSEQVLTHRLGGAVHHQPVLRQQLLSPFPAFRRPLCSLKGPGFQQRMAGIGLQSLLETGARTSSPHAQLQGGRERTGSALGSTWTVWSCDRPPNGNANPSHLSSPVRCRESPPARAAVPARWARPQAAGRPLRAELGQRNLSPGGHRGRGRSPASCSPVRLAKLILPWLRRCPRNPALQQACPAVFPRPRRCPLPTPWEADLLRPLGGAGHTTLHFIAGAERLGPVLRS